MKKNIHLTILITFCLLSCGRKTEEVTPIRKDVTEAVFASGILEADNTYTLKAQTDGYLKEIHFVEGDRITIGSLLAVIDNRENVINDKSAAALYQIAENNIKVDAPALLQAQNNIAVNKLKVSQDSLQLARYKSLWLQNSVSRVDYENASLQYNTSLANYENALESFNILKQQARQQLISSTASKNVNKSLFNNNTLKAIVPGKILRKYKQAGDYVSRGEAIALIGDSNALYAKVNVDEGNIGRVKLGQKALVQLNTDKGIVYDGVVSEIYPSFDEASQSFLCKIKFSKKPGFEVVNTQLQANIIVGFTKNAMLIPRNYVDYSGNVMIKGRKNSTRIKTKFMSSDWVQVISGIHDFTILSTENIAENNVPVSELGSQMH
ncbi:MAG: transporter [Flavobacterium sp. BFFFF1]|uniref:efflux RND transporter periplasmic adaptor subunit n=1 Tax=Flavobacterium sp. BFFFF1 TaxID=2015557 RepID=UPI000BD9F363|nr:HlyD family efflux transporter periplasmic adaptor subunit [Flavobacterium sp. BFFFF1]OYU80712.1 MAG: transporter [Flavobacterium sp. BFFFF1]